MTVPLHMTETPQRDRRSVRHTVRVVTRARELADAGWTRAEVQRRLVVEFDLPTPPSATTIRLWVDDGYRDWYYRDLRLRRERARSRRREEHVREPRPGVFRGPRVLTDELLLQLRESEGFSYQTLSRLSERFYGVGVNEHTLRSRLVALGAERNPNKTRRAVSGDVEYERKAAA